MPRLSYLIQELLNLHWDLESEDASHSDRRVQKLCADVRTTLTMNPSRAQVAQLRMILLEQGMKRDMPLFWESLHDEDWSKRHEAWLNLTNWGRMQHARGLRWALADESSILRRDAAIAAGQGKWPGTLPVLKAALNSEKDPWAKGGIAIGLAFFGDELGLRQLIQDTVATDPYVRKLARKYLDSMECNREDFSTISLHPLPSFEAFLTHEEAENMIREFGQTFPDVFIEDTSDQQNLMTYRFNISNHRPMGAIWIPGSNNGPLQLTELRGKWWGHKPKREWWRRQFLALPVRWFEGRDRWSGFPIHVSESAWNLGQQMGFSDQGKTYHPCDDQPE